MKMDTRAFYLTSGVEPVYALFDPPAAPAGPSSSGASASVLLGPLFGNDDLCAYRARREWARMLAAAGHPTLRIDLPGTGDSGGGPNEPGRVDAWTDALNTAASWLHEEAGPTRLTAIGIGLGGMLAFRAATQGGQIEDLALWSVPARGRTLVRQLRVLSRMETSSVNGAGLERSPAEDGALAIAGFLMSAETVATLEALDLTQLELPDALQRRVLLLERDGLDVDLRLRATIEQGGAKVTVAKGPGYGAMVTPPQRSRAPLAVFATVEKWLSVGEDAPMATSQSSSSPSLGVAASRSGVAPAANAAVTSDRRSRTAECLEMLIDGVHIRERPMTVEHAGGRLFGILAEPEEPGPVCAVLLNAGALRHIGPGRMWVDLARRWAARGVPTLRMDLAGIGDADGEFEPLREDDGFYVPSFVAETRTVLDALAERGMPERFVLAGLCSGAYWSLHAALQDRRVAAAYMVNPRALFWDWRIPGVHHARNVRKLVHTSTWQRFLRGEIRARHVSDLVYSIAGALRTLPTRSWTKRQISRGPDELELALEQLERAGVALLAVFTAEEPLLLELERDGRLARMMQRSNVRIERIPGPLVSHTLEPLSLQRAVNRVLDRALDQQLYTAVGGDPGERHQLSSG